MQAPPTCAVIGAGPGIGLSVARRFGKEGHRVALLARRAGPLEEHRAKLADAGIEAAAFTCDAGRPDDVARALGEVQGRLGAPSVLVYNAMAFSQGPPSKVPLDTLVDDFRVNVGGALAAAQAVLPGMRAAGRGTILITGGGLALDPYPQFASLAVGKAGVRSIAFSLAKELAPENIHVATVTVCGFVKPGTPFDPDLIAEVYWTLANEPKESWRTEVQFRG